MNCYLCLVEMGKRDQSAYALCQRCGAGMCEAHLKELQFCPVAGMAHGSHPTFRYSLICERCYFAATSFTRPVQTRRKQGLPMGRGWWQQFFRRPSPEVPIEEDAVTIAEQFLKQERMR